MADEDVVRIAIPDSKRQVTTQPAPKTTAPPAVKKPAVKKPAKKTPAKKVPAKKAAGDAKAEGVFEKHDKKKAGDKKAAEKKKEKLDQKKYDDAFAMYGWQKALIESDPELKKLFDQALKEGWSQAQFVAKAQNTKWFKTKGLAFRENEVKRLQDPATWRAEKQTRISNLTNMAQRMGAQLSPTQANTIAEQWMSLGWDESQVGDALEKYVGEVTTPGSEFTGQFIGDAGKAQAQLIQFAKRNAYKMPDGSMSKWVKSVIDGSATVDDYEQFIRRQTAAAYGAFADEIMAGADLMDVASPYINTYQRLLERADIGLDDPLIQKALNSPGQDGKVGAMPLWQFEQQLKKDARYDQTEGAKEEAKSKGKNIMSLLGL